MKTLILGIDPGASGGIAEFWPDGKVQTAPMLDDPDLADCIEALRACARSSDYAIAAYLEQVGGYIGKAQPGSSMFKFGDGYGFIRGLLAANRIPTHLVRPQTWQKGIPGLTGVKGPDRKRALKEQAARLFPNARVTLSTADALLIGEWGRKQPR